MRILPHLKGVWRRWLKFAEILGNIQMIIILTIIYWILVSVTAIPYKLFTDRLGLRRSGTYRWVSRGPVPDVLEAMRRQG